MRLSLAKPGLWIIAGLVAVTALASILLLASSLQTQCETDRQVRQHFENVSVLRRTQALIVDAETGQRGYLLTAQPQFLSPYYVAERELPVLLKQLVITQPSSATTA